jgi:uncharacterized membrane protein HdeD (DUF308 family)
MANPTQTAERLHAAGFDELYRHSNWFLALGLALIVLGLIALGAATATTVASLILFGWLLIIGGILEIAYALWRRTWSGFLIDLVIGVLYVVVGFMVVANPAATALGLTLLVAMFLIVGGLLRIISAFAIRYPNWGWLVFHGVVALVLGILIWQGLPQTALWVIGLYIGIELIVNGFALLMLGMAAKKLDTSRP